MAVKRSALFEHMNRNVIKKTRARAASARARILSEEISDGTVTRTEGNDSIKVEVFTPTAAAQQRGFRNTLVIKAGDQEITLGGHNIRTIYRVLANHLGAAEIM